MSLKPLTLHTATGLHTFESYVLPQQTTGYALSRYPRKGGNRWPGARGDRLPELEVLTVTLMMVADNLLDMTHDALDLIDDLETVHHVGCHQGDYKAVGLLSYQFGAPVGLTLPVTLSIAVTSFYGFRPALDTTVGWDSDSVISTVGIPNTNPAFTVPGMSVIRTTKPSPVLTQNRTSRLLVSEPGWDGGNHVEVLAVLRTSRNLASIASPLRLGLFAGNAAQDTTLNLTHQSPYVGEMRLTLVNEDDNVVMRGAATTIQVRPDVWVAYRMRMDWVGAGVTRFRAKAWTAESNPGGEPDWMIDRTRIADTIARVGMRTSGLHFNETRPDEYVDIGLFVVTFGEVEGPRLQL